MIDRALYQIFKIIKHETLTGNLLARIYANEIEKKIIFKIKSRYYGEPLTPETINLLRSTKKKITNDKNSENVFYLDN